MKTTFTPEQSEKILEAVDRLRSAHHLQETADLVRSSLTVNLLKLGETNTENGMDYLTFFAEDLNKELDQVNCINQFFADLERAIKQPDPVS